MTLVRDCPCSGQSMTLFTAPWILLTLYGEDGRHGYELAKIVKGHMEKMGVSLNTTGLYRHLRSLEKRGMLRSAWETPDKGQAKRRYFITEDGKYCLWTWIGTLRTQFDLMVRFFEEAQNLFPDATFPGKASETDGRSAMKEM
ncbi:MAG: helix-turn-helix transcriptional regulator [Deltaproteobacteria bacterium]|nr:helix-turn-helix transcriptional regulator [Deltaproteobacteria bacterium]